MSTRRRPGDVLRADAAGLALGRGITGGARAWTARTLFRAPACPPFMFSPSNRPSWTTLFAGTTLVWFGLSVVLTVQETTFSLRPQVWLRGWLFTAPRCVSGLAFTLVVFAGTRILPIRGNRWKRNLGVHVVAALILTGLGIATQQLLLRALRPEYAARVSFWEGWGHVLGERGNMALLIYAGFVGLYHAMDKSPADSPSDGSADPASEADEGTRTADRISVRTGDAHIHRSSMRAMANRLAARPFLRVHRSTIVRLDAVERLETPSAAGHYEVVLRDGTRRRVSDRYREALLDALGAPS